MLLSRLFRPRPSLHPAALLPSTIFLAASCCLGELLLQAAGAQTLTPPVSLAWPTVSRGDGPAPLARAPGAVDPLTGVRSPMRKDWIGLRSVAPNTPILVMAGHADSQGIAGSGTSGEAAGLLGAAPMMRGITDEHYWNLVMAHAVASLGRERGLRIDFYKPPFRTILDPDHPGTNWSVGRQHALADGYAFEIHFDAYGPSGVGSGLIPPLHRPFSRIDESLAQEFGAYPMNFRDRLGGPKRGVAILELGKLEGRLEASLRDPNTRQQTVRLLAERIVSALEVGLGRGAGQATPSRQVSSQPAALRTGLPGLDRPTNVGGE
ncbi:MAG: dehydrogenase [Cyanobacteriota bacterium]|nr:dehydrogenase [Cyanobacteriota bacterium]